MTKTIILSLAATALVYLSGGCGGSNNGKDMGGGGADMAGFQCVMNPTSDPGILNGCPPSGVDTYVITPTFPTLAPNGVLPALQ
jgi:hypothetical protein